MLGSIQLWEAKRIQLGKTAYDPKQLSGSQRFFMRMIARYAPECGGVLLLAEDGFAEVPARRALSEMTVRAFNRRKESYRG
jgi:hypothetical protein